MFSFQSVIYFKRFALVEVTRPTVENHYIKKTFKTPIDKAKPLHFCTIFFIETNRIMSVKRGGLYLYNCKYELDIFLPVPFPASIPIEAREFYCVGENSRRNSPENILSARCGEN